MVAAVAILAALGGAGWWAVQPNEAGRLIGIELPTSVAERHAAVADQVADEVADRRTDDPAADPRRQARLAALRARPASAAPSGLDATDPPAAITPAPAVAGSAPTAAVISADHDGIGAAPAPGAPLGMVPADRTARLLASRVNEQRQDRATRLRWLDACRKQGLVDLARARIAAARDDADRNAAGIAAGNLAADLANHQREVRRLEELLENSEQRLAAYCAERRQVPPELEDPPTTVDGRLAQPPVQPAAGQAGTVRAAGGGRGGGGGRGFNAFADTP